MKTSTVVLGLLLSSLVIFTSCTGDRGDDDADDEYRTGSTGLELEFMANAPPDKIYTGNPMDIIIEVRNRGAYPGKGDPAFEGKLDVYGYDEQAFIGAYWDGGPDLKSGLSGRSPFSPQGGRVIKRYAVEEVDTLFGSEFYEPNVVASACYRYMTLAEPLVCIDTNLHSAVDDDKVCRVSSRGETYSLGTQGAPVAITKVEQEITGDNIHFGIHVSNVGDGKVIHPNFYYECPHDLNKYTHLDKLVIRDVRLPNAGMPECQPKGTADDPVRLDESGDGFVYCTFRNIPNKKAYQTVLQIRLDYIYLDWIEKDIKIVNLDR